MSKFNENEIRNLFDIMVVFFERKKIKFKLGFEEWINIVAAIFFVVSVIFATLYHFEKIVYMKEIALISLLLAQVSVIILFVYILLDSVKKIINVSQYRFVNLKTKVVHDELKLIQTLQKFSIYSLQFVVDTLKHEDKTINYKNNMILGSFAKLGLLPAIISIILTLSQLFFMSHFEYKLAVIVNVFGASLVGMYLGHFIFKYSVIKNRHAVFLIEQAIKFKNQNI